MNDPRHAELFDQELRAFLAVEAEDRRGVPSAAEVAMRMSAAPGVASLGRGSGISLAWLILAGLLAIALAGVVLIGVGGQRDRLAVVPAPSASSTAYAPVFLRLTDDGELIVVRVDADGGETELLQLPDAFLLGDYRYGGAISTRGLLAVPRPAALQFHWEIFDLVEPGTEPIVVPGTEQAMEPFLWEAPYVGRSDRGGAFWGPRDQLALVSAELVSTGDASSFVNDWHVTFVDGRTGQARRVDLPEGDEYILPQWTQDGSGVLLADRLTEKATGVLRQDGTIDRDVPEETWSFCESVERDGIACQSPDGSVNVRVPGTVDPSQGRSFDVDGVWAGWLEVPS